MGKLKLIDLMQQFVAQLQALVGPPEPVPPPVHYRRAGPTHGQPLPPPPGYRSWPEWSRAGCPEWWHDD